MNKFSVTTKGFYAAPLIQAYVEEGCLPEDAIDVSSEEESEIRSALTRGDKVERLKDGRFEFTPRAIDFDELSSPVLREVRAARDIVLNRIANKAVFSDDVSNVNRLKVAREEFLDVTECESALKQNDRESMRAEFAKAFQDICKFDIGLLNGTFAEVK